jgi:hypothetical protein
VKYDTRVRSTQPASGYRGVVHFASTAEAIVAGTGAAVPNEHVKAPTLKSPPVRVTTVPPNCGPVHGVRASTDTLSCEKKTLLDEYSWPFVDTATDKNPGFAPVTLQPIEVAFIYTAGTTVALIRHSSAPRDSADSMKPLPCTVIGVPPSAAPREGHRDDATTDRVYVNAAVPDVNCCPFEETSARRAPSARALGVAHSSSPTLTRRATADAPSKRQVVVAAGITLDPSMVIRVPPSMGPLVGITELVCKESCTKNVAASRK